MAPRAYLSEEAETEEREDRDKLRALRGRLHDLVERRRLALAEFRKLSDEQQALYEARQPGQRELERLDEEYRALGNAMGGARKERDAARQRLDESLAALREFRSTHPRGEVARPDQIRREIAELEHRQQTQSLTLAEENALIARMRQATKRAQEAELETAERAAREKKFAELNAAVAARRAELRTATDEFPRLRAERDQRMQAIRARLEGAGQLVAGLRAKAQARGAAMDRLRAISAEIEKLEREGDAIMAKSRGRRDEARQAIADYRKEVRAAAEGPGAPGSVEDRQLEELLKRGRVTLRG